MHPVSQQIIGQILNPTDGPAPAEPASVPSTMTLEQIVHPRGAAGYSGPERRAQGYLVAEEVAPPAPGAAAPAREP